MARGQRKTIEEKILQKQEIINNLSVRIGSEQNELQALVNYPRAKSRWLPNQYL